MLLFVLTWDSVAGCCMGKFKFDSRPVNPLNTKRISVRRGPSPYRAVNTLHVGCKNQSVYAVSGTSRCLFSDKYKAQTALFKDPVRTAL